MMEIGQQVMQGLGNGMDGMRSHVMGIASSVSSTLANAFTGVITGAQSVEDALKNVLAQMASMITNKVFNYFLNAAFGGGGGGGLGGLFGGLFGGFRADGGPVTAGRSYIVGERGPELFMPSSSGTIVPSLSGASAGNDNVQINIINNSGAQVRQSRRRTANGQAIDVMIDDAVAGKISTPGSASRGALKSQFGLNSGLAKR
jgi:phage-related minor tail protein